MSAYINGMIFSEVNMHCHFLIKKLTKMNISIKTFTILFAAATLYACNDDKTSSTTTNTDTTSANNSPKMDTSTNTTSAMDTETSTPEQEFINYAVPGNTKEIIWLKAGMSKATSKEIKSHAAMMLKDHNNLGAHVKDYMSKKPNLTMPALDTANEVNINDKTGADWDKAWADKMVADHSDLLDKLKVSKTNVKDPDLNKLITGAIPVVASHLSMVKMLQSKLSK